MTAPEEGQRTPDAASHENSLPSSRGGPKSGCSAAWGPSSRTGEFTECLVGVCGPSSQHPWTAIQVLTLPQSQPEIRIAYRCSCTGSNSPYGTYFGISPWVTQASSASSSVSAT